MYPASCVDHQLTISAWGVCAPHIITAHVSMSLCVRSFMCGWHPWFCVGADAAAAVVQLDPRTRWNVCNHAGVIPGTHAAGYSDVVPIGTHSARHAALHLTSIVNCARGRSLLLPLARLPLKFPLTNHSPSAMLRACVGACGTTQLHLHGLTASNHSATTSGMTASRR